MKDVTQLVLARRTRMCNFLEYKGPPLTQPPITPFPMGLNPFMIDADGADGGCRYESHLPTLRLFILHLFRVTGG